MRGPETGGFPRHRGYRTPLQEALGRRRVASGAIRDALHASGKKCPGATARTLCGAMVGKLELPREPDSPCRGSASFTPAPARVVSTLHAQGTAWILPAIPVAPADALPRLRLEADEVICPMAPWDFEGLSDFYLEFPQLEDDEVIRALAAAAAAVRPDVTG